MKSEKVYFYSFQVFNIGNARDVLFNGYGLVSYPNAVDAFKNIKGHIEKAVLEGNDSLKKDEMVI